MSRERAGRRDADIDLSAGANVRKLRFKEEPETRTTFWGDASRRSFSESQRLNLPAKVRKGVEYREASIQWEARGWVAEGEEPAEKDGERRHKKGERGAH